MARKVGIVWAAEDTAAALHARYRVEGVVEVRTRLHALWLLRRGKSPAVVASVVGVGLRSVHRWLQWYREGGLEAVCGRCKGGPGKPSFLTPAQEQQVVAAAATGVFATAQAVRDWIEQQFGVVYTRDSMYTLLPRLGIRLGLRGQVRKVWTPRGVPVCQAVQIGWSYIHVAVALDPRTGQLWWAWQKNMKGEEMARIWGIWAKEPGIDGWVWDGAGGHTGKDMQAIEGP